MKSARVAPIVEGHGEVEAIRTLLDRTWRELVHGEYLDVLQPIRTPRTKLLRKASTGGLASEPDRDEIARAVQLAAMKLKQKRETPIAEVILLLLDADEDCPKELGPALLAAAGSAADPKSVAVVLAKREYETWFVAAARSLDQYLKLTEPLPTNPEDQGCGKAWINKHFRRAQCYSEVVDQVRLTAAMDLTACRARSRSFARLCRILETLAASPTCATDERDA